MARPGTTGVETFIAGLGHPCTAEIRALRAIILAADPAIAEGIKWNVPSFRTCEYFATLHLRARRGIGVILHFGAKQRAVATAPIADPHGLLQWLAADRAQVVFDDLAAIRAHESALTDLIRSWIAQV